LFAQVFADRNEWTLLNAVGNLGTIGAIHGARKFMPKRAIFDGHASTT
jgi:hypothetical protein